MQGVTLAFAAILCATQAFGRDLEMQLEAALHREVILGDIKGAMEQYKAIFSDPTAPKGTAARALFQSAKCLEKSARRADARAAYALVLKNYAGHPEALAARLRLTNLDETIPGPSNLTFAQGVAGKLPPAWFVPALPKDGDQWAQLRRIGCMREGNCAVVLVPENAPTNVGNLMQSFAATAYRGKTVRLAAWLRLEGTGRDDRAQMWLSVDRSNNRKGFFDNMDDRALRSPEWTRCEIQARVDDDATFIKFGVMSIGRGRVWVDSVSLEIVPAVK